MKSSLRSLFLLDPDIIFLNHGSFGATPWPVFETYQEWQRRLETQPVRFLARDLPEYDRQARQALGDFLHAGAGDLVFVPNATHGVNIIARSLALEPGDEILASDHEYGACDNAWNFICQKRGAVYRRQPVPLPVSSQDEIVERIWAGVTPRTRLIFLSHITSSTALRFPVEQICRRARASGILTLIDGAHAPGQIPVDLRAIGADFYTGNCHKWMMAPKGSAFLYTRPERQPLVEPLVVSWGWGGNGETSTGSRYLDCLGWTGTKDPCAVLSIPAAIQFMQTYHWDEVRQHCKELLCQALRRITGLTGLPPLYPDEGDFYTQMGCVMLPPLSDPAAYKNRLYDEFRIEIPIIEWNGRHYLRISVQGYNSQEDIDALIEAIVHKQPLFENAIK